LAQFEGLLILGIAFLRLLGGGPKQNFVTKGQLALHLV
jgi:hypothetical protein